MEAKLLKVNPEEYGLEKTKGTEIEQGLIVSISERELLIKEFEEISALEITTENIHLFKELRLKLVKNRTQGADAWHRTGKEVSLRLGQFYDAVKKRENQINKSMETILMDGENHFETLEKERLAKLQTKRVSLISEYIEDANERDLSGMDEDVWKAYFETKKQTHLDMVAANKKAEKERIAEEKRIEAERIAKEKEEKANQERIEKDNERLQKEAEERERLAEVESKKREKEDLDRKAKEEKERLEREKIETKRLEVERKEREKQDAILQEEREERERLESELQAKKDKEISDKKELEEKERLAGLAPDKDKLIDWVKFMRINKPELKSKEALEIQKEIEEKFEGFTIWAMKKVDMLK